MEVFSNYRNMYEYVRMDRDDKGVLEFRLHTQGGPLRWGHIGGAHEQLSDAFRRVAADPGNRVVIITGTGDEFSGPKASAETFPYSDVASWDVIQRNAFILTWNMLSIDAPVISCVNGPALRHAEIPLLADIVLACPEAAFQDSAHFVNETVPGDGVNLFMPLLLGLNRARYFLFTGQRLDALEAKELGLVNEIHERDDLLGRARELASHLADQNPLVLKYTRRIIMQPLKELVLRHLDHGLALEGLAAVSVTVRSGRGATESG